MIKEEVVGQTLRGDQSFLISQESITAFAQVIGELNLSVAPPTYAFTIIIKAFEVTLKDSGMNWDRMVHGDQKFEIIHPLAAGDQVRVDTTIESVRLVAGNELVTVRADIYRDDQSNEKILMRAWSTLVVRGS